MCTTITALCTPSREKYRYNIYCVTNDSACNIHHVLTHTISFLCNYYRMLFFRIFIKVYAVLFTTSSHELHRQQTTSQWKMMLMVIIVRRNVVVYFFSLFQSESGTTQSSGKRRNFFVRRCCGGRCYLLDSATQIPVSEDIFTEKVVFTSNTIVIYF